VEDAKVAITKNYEELLELLYEGIYLVDNDRTILSWNKGAEKITGYRAAEVVGKKCYDNILNHVDESGNQLCLLGCPLHATIGDGNAREARVFLQHKKGFRVPIAVKTMPTYDESGRITGAAEIFIDDKNKVQILNSLEKYKREATEDSLTMLPNRRSILAALGSRMNENIELEVPFGIAFMDIDNFKMVNDVYGHDAGDEILKMVAKTLDGNLRKQDLVGRWGGEEFVAIFSDVDVNGIESVTEKMRFLVAESKIRKGLDEIKVTISIGVTIALPGDTAKGLVDRADRLMYESKKAGKNRVTIG
jgi:diguanylate cyclase (GGDEF)-like protein/PAS domain S-box-containing protein